nr:DUF1294 domain-containing protein [uncultured Prevotella sp.]
MNDLMFLYFMSILTFALYAWDKHLAIFQYSRIPEIVLLLLSFIGGAFGALCAMVIFAHKTLHKKFVICVPIFLAMQLVIIILFRTL